MIWRSRTGSPRAAPARRRDVDDQLDALDRGLQRHGGDGFVDHVAQIEVDALELQAVGLDLRQVEHVVDQRQQRLGAAADDVDVLALGVDRARSRRGSATCR
jgi:hypothetical protein